MPSIAAPLTALSEPRTVVSGSGSAPLSSPHTSTPLIHAILNSGMSVNIEGLGTFYLGCAYDLAQKKQLPEPIIYDSKDLVTPAGCAPRPAKVNGKQSVPLRR